MLKFIGRRILMMIPIMLGVVLLVFSMLYFSPGEPAKYVLGDMATEEDIAMFNEENGLNDPFLVQYVNYIADALHGDLGISYTTKQPVIDEIIARFPTTFKLTIVSTLVSVVIGITLGIISAVKQYSIWDNIVRVIAMVGAGITSWKHWILPAITIGTASSAGIMRMTRSSMLEAIRQDYVRTARAKGQKEMIIICVHALRNAIIPVMTLIGINFSRMLGGSAISEVVFAIPGLGNLIISAINVKNAPLVQGGILFIAVVMAFCNLIVDVLYAYVDPRIRSQYVKPKAAKAAVKKEAA